MATSTWTTRLSSNVDTYRGGIDRSGVMPGTGPTAPVSRRWEFKADSPIGTSPAVVDDVVYVAANGGTVTALDLATGAVRWHHTLSDPPLSSPSIAAGLVLVGANRHLHALDAATGAERWSAPADGTVAGAPTVVDRTVLFATDAGSVLAVQLSDGAAIWKTAMGAAITRTMAVLGDSVFTGADGGVVVALRISDGAVEWRARTGAAGAVSTIEAVDGSVYACTGLDDTDVTTHHLVALDAGSGQERWRYSNTSGVPVYPPAVVGDRVYVVGEDRHVTALDRTSGAPIWTFETKGIDEAAPAWAAGVLYVPDDAGTLYAIDTASGAELWRTSFTGGPYAPVVDGGLILVPTSLGLLDAFGSGG